MAFVFCKSIQRKEIQCFIKNISAWHNFCCNVYVESAKIIFALAFSSEPRKEIIRKIIHFLIALTPFMASVNRPVTMFILAAGTLSYIYIEKLRLCGTKIPVISSLIGMASRPRDMGHFVMGPVTLGFGAFMALLLYQPQAAAIAIYALAFGDGFASLVGRFLGALRPVFLSGKSIEGSMACFAAVFICAYMVSYDTRIAAVAAFAAMVIEALPLGDYDNIALPVSVGMVVHLLLL